jgi:hypothetical protein
VTSGGELHGSWLRGRDAEQKAWMPRGCGSS